MRVLISPCLVSLLFLSACGSDSGGAISAGGAPGVGGTGTETGGGPAAPTAGTGATPSVGSGGTAPSSGGSGNGTGGTAVASGGSGPPTTSASGKGNGDDGDLFPPGSYVPFDPNAGGTTGGPSTGGGTGASTDATVTSQIGGSVNGSAKFTQKGTDVTVVVKLTKCSNGTLGIHINSGDSCDNTGTEGKPWDGKRGNIGDSGSIVCSNGSANLTYTRSGTDPALNWTIGDHNLKTDITNYVVIVSQNADGSGNYLGCGNFFK